MVYKFTVSPDNSLAGYVNNSLSYFNVSDFQAQSIPAENFIEGHGAVNICRHVCSLVEEMITLVVHVLIAEYLF